MHRCLHSFLNRFEHDGHVADFALAWKRATMRPDLAMRMLVAPGSPLACEQREEGSGMSAQRRSLGELVRRHRVAAGLSQEALAARAGVSRRGVSDIERGVIQAPRDDTLSRLADALA
jgi:ribosome-binding protein aMBF1 (putative translation factor)